MLRSLRAPATGPVVILLTVLLVLTACATTPLGKAVETTSIQKDLVERATIEFMKLHYRHVVDDSVYAIGRDLYTKWAAAETAVALTLARWKTNQTDANGAALQTTLDQWKALADAYLGFVGKFVDISKITQAPN